ncbi:MAG: DUF4175 family protein [bacterium]
MLFYFVTIVFFTTAAEYLFRFPSWFRVVLMIVSITAGLYLIVQKLLIPLYSLFFRKDVPDDNTLALKVGDFFPEIGDRLANSLQIFLSSEKNRYGTSRELALQALISAARQSEKYNFKESVSKKVFLRPLKFVLISLLITVIFFLFFNMQLSAGFNRLIHPFTTYAVSPDYRLTLLPGNTTIVQGEDIDISVKVDGTHPENLFLYYQHENTDSDFLGEKLTPPFVKKFNSVRKSFEYFVQTDKVKTDHFMVKVLIRPLIKKLQLQLRPPAYSRLPAETLPPNRGDVECLKGTRVEMSIQGNKKLSESTIDFKNRQDMDLKIHSNQGTGIFYVLHPDSYFVFIKDSSGLKNSNPISYSIRIEPDYPPVINVLSPEQSMDLDEQMLVPLIIDAADDFGVSDMRIGYQVSRGKELDSSQEIHSFISLPVDSHEPSEVRVEYPWRVDSLNLFPEDIIHYFIEVFDNDRISGPKKVRTPLYSARFPSMAEIFDEVSAKQEDQIAELEEVYKSSDQIKKELDKISRQLKSEGELDWEEKKNVEQVSEQQQDLNQKMKDLNRGLEDVVDQLKKNQMISPETLEKYEELQDLYREIDSPELRKVLEELEKIMQDIDPEKLRKSIDNFQMAQQNFQKAIEHTISLLKRLKVEQVSEALTKRFQELTERQKQINQQLSGKQKKDIADQIRQEETIQQDIPHIKENMNELYKDMSELSQMPLNQMKAATDSLDRGKLSERTEEMISMMQSGNSGQAKESGGKIEKSMQTVTRMMEDVSKSLKAMQKNRVTKALQRSGHTLLRISQEQESLHQARQRGRITKSKAAVFQTGLMSGLDQVVDSLMALSQKTLFITPRIGRSLGKAKANMQEALKNMDTNKESSVSHFQNKAVGSLNQGVMAIEEALERMQGGGTGMGMDDFLMQMQQMAGEQSRLNRETMDMLDKGSLSLAQQAAMSRLAQQQQAIKKAVEKLIREVGSEEKYTGRLDRTLQDMNKVIKDLQERNFDQETLERQQRILSRMLELQHSVRKRDYSKQRLSTAGKEIIRTSPEALYFDKSRLEKQIRRDILRLPEEGYTKEYQKLIREYYQLLFQKKALVEEEKEE